MKLFLVIYVFNQVGGFAGPLPYDLNECIARRDQMRLKQAIGLEAGIDRTTAPVLGETRS